MKLHFLSSNHDYHTGAVYAKNETELSGPIGSGKVFHKNQTDNDMTDRIVWSTLKLTWNCQGLSNQVRSTSRKEIEFMCLIRPGAVCHKNKEG